MYYSFLFVKIHRYAWYDLSHGPYKIKFESDGQFESWSLKLSVSGAEKNDSFLAFLDGDALAWTTSGDLDRHFSEWQGNSGLSKGMHELEFRQGFPSTTGRARQLCSLDFHEYGNASVFSSENAIISAYPTFSLDGKKSFRPSNEGCLMRNMIRTTFCSVCMEGLWENLMTRMTLVDSIQQTCLEDGNIRIQLFLLPLGQFRLPFASSDQDEMYIIRWFYNGKSIPRFKNKNSVDISSENINHEWSVLVKFKTKYVRNDFNKVLEWRGDNIKFQNCPPRKILINLSD